MSELSPPRSTRAWHPSKRFEEWGNVGRVIQPSTTESQAAEQAQLQQAAAARGNASRPGPLPPTKRKAGDARTSILDRQLDNIFVEEERVEWLYQAIEQFGDTHNYRNDPEFQDEGALWEVWDDLQSTGFASHPPAPPPKNHPHIRFGLTKALEPQQPGRSVASKLVRTDSTTITLDGTRVEPFEDDEHDHLPPAKLARTDGSTITLDGTRLSPPRTNVSSRSTTKAPTTSNRLQRIPLARQPGTSHHTQSTHSAGPPRSASQATATPRTPLANTSAAPPKRAVVPRARVEALREESAAKARIAAEPRAVEPRTAKPLAAKPRAPEPLAAKPRAPEPPAAKPRAPKSLAPKPRAPRPLAPKPRAPGPLAINHRVPEPGAPAPRSPVDVEMNEPSGDEAKGPPPQVGEPGEDNDNGDDSGDDNDIDNTSRLGTKRQKSQLSSFTPAAAKIAEWVMERVRVELAVTCPFPERMGPRGPPADPSESYLEEWVTRLWADAHQAVWPNRPCIRMQDCHVAFIRNQLAPTQNGMKHACEGLLASHYDLRRSDPDHVVKATALTNDEKWLSPNLANDDKRFQHDIIIDTIRNGFFRTTRSLGVWHKARFVPLVPLSTIAYTCSIIRHQLRAFEVNRVNASDLSSTANLDSYNHYMGMLKDFGARNPGWLFNARMKITLDYLKTHPVSTAPSRAKMNFGPDQAVDEENLLEIKEIFGETVPEIEDWEELQAVNRSQKGKSRAVDPSRRDH